MRRRSTLFIAAAAALGCLAPAAAVASTVAPAAPTGAHVVAVSGTSFTVAVNSAAHATGYRLFASTRKSDVYVANIARARASAVARTPRMTIGGLTYTTATYYYRVETLNGPKHRFNALIHSVALRPATPTGLRLSTTAEGATYLTWSGGTGTGYAIDQATNPAMTSGHRSYSIRGANHQFTPYGMAKNSTYYFRVRAANHGTYSGWTGVVHATVRTAEQSLTVMTYNILEANLAGQTESGQSIASWPSRRAGVVSLIKQGSPDILCIQEAAAFIGSPPPGGYTRQVDDLVQALGGSYGLARTETPPTEAHWMRTGNYVLYKLAAFAPVGEGGHWTLDAVGVPNTRWAAYQELQSRATGGTVLVVTPHLITSDGESYDIRRENETKTMMQQANTLAAGIHAPVVYAGDFNSNVTAHHVFDGPGIAMRAAGVADAYQAAQQLDNATYNSANQNLRTPPAFSDSVDYVYATPGVAVLSRWVLLPPLSDGKFVGVIPSDHNPVQARLYIRY